MPVRMLAAAVTLIALASCMTAKRAAETALTDQEFWRIATTFSEPAADFEHDDNLVSNERLFAHLAEQLRARGGGYIGVGPEQNFSYIARLQPVLAFVVDIREENQNLHLMYKALFELSADRADFVKRLFARERPAGTHRRAPVDDLFTAFERVRPSAEIHQHTRRAVRAQLVDVHRFPLSAAQLQSIDDLLTAFYMDGPQIRYGRARPPSPARPPYRQLMTATDFRGEPRSYLATEDAFAFVKDLQARNLIVPVVGDFAGPHAIRRIGEYVRQQGHLVSVFYGSNVEVYLTRDQRRAFCGNLESLPHDEATVFIASRRMQLLTAKLVACAAIPPSLKWR